VTKETASKLAFKALDAARMAWNAALASKEAEIAASDWETSPPLKCGHPRACWISRPTGTTSREFYCAWCAEIATKNAELQSVREAYMEIERKLQIKLASAEARIEAAMKLADELRKKSVSAREDRIAYELIRALGRKVEP
jgi:hypothetical protein